MKPKKYKNTKISIIINEGNLKQEEIEFHSILEKDRYIYLSMLERTEEISGLVKQPQYLLQEGYVRKGKKIRPEYYVGDFQYKNKVGKITVEDAKGARTRLYMSKVKRFLYLYPEIEFLEVYKAKGGFREKYI